MDAKENAYHMLFLGMCITLRSAYKVTSNIEAGYGRSDITLESLSPANSHVIIEFKQGEDIERLKEEAPFIHLLNSPSVMMPSWHSSFFFLANSDQ